MKLWLPEVWSPLGTSESIVFAICFLGVDLSWFVAPLAVLTRAQLLNLFVPSEPLQTSVIIPPSFLYIKLESLFIILSIKFALFTKDEWSILALSTLLGNISSTWVTSPPIARPRPISLSPWQIRLEGRWRKTITEVPNRGITPYQRRLLNSKSIIKIRELWRWTLRIYDRTKRKMWISLIRKLLTRRVQKPSMLAIPAARLVNCNSDVVLLFDRFYRVHTRFQSRCKYESSCFAGYRSFEGIILLKCYPLCERLGGPTNRSTWRNSLRRTYYIGPLSWRRSLLGLLSSTRRTQQLDISLAEVLSTGNSYVMLYHLLPSGWSIPSSLFIPALFSMSEVPASFANRPIILRHQKAAMYHPMVDALALTLVDVPFTLANMILFTIIVYFIAGLQVSAAQFLWVYFTWIFLDFGPNLTFYRNFSTFFLFILVLALSMNALVRSLAAAFKRAAPTQAVAGVLFLGLALYTGYQIPKPSMIGALRWISYINVSFETLLLVVQTWSLTTRILRTASPIRFWSYHDQRIPHFGWRLLYSCTVRSWVWRYLRGQPSVYGPRVTAWSGESQWKHLSGPVFRLLFPKSMESSCLTTTLPFFFVTDQYSRTLESLSLLAYSSFCASWFLPNSILPVRLVKAPPYCLSKGQKRKFLGRLLVMTKRKCRLLLPVDHLRLQDPKIQARRVKRCMSSLRWPRHFRGDTLIMLSLFLVNVDYCWMMFRVSSLRESWPLWWENLVLERCGLFNMFAFLILIFVSRPLYWTFFLTVLEPVLLQGTAFSMVKLCLSIFRLRQVTVSRWTLTCLLLLYSRL